MKNSGKEFNWKIFIVIAGSVLLIGGAAAIILTARLGTADILTFNSYDATSNSIQIELYKKGDSGANITSITSFKLENTSYALNSNRVSNNITTNITYPFVIESETAMSLTLHFDTDLTLDCLYTLTIYYNEGETIQAVFNYHTT